MLVSILPVPFADAACQRQYEAVLAALHAEAEAPATVLLGNLGAFTPIEADMLLVRPDALALVVLVPQAGQLTMMALATGNWQLGGQPLPGHAGADNPFAQCQQQVPVALAWLSEQLDLPEAELPACIGMALFEAPLTFGPEVETQLHRHTAAHDFQLVGGAAQLPARLRQPQATTPAALDAGDLLEWGEYLANESYVAHHKGISESLLESPASFLEQKLRQLWRWLGAADIPADPPYGGPPPDQQEHARLQQLRYELQAELSQQRQEAAAREATRTQELAHLRQQLAQAGLSATERRAEQQATSALEDELRTARAELGARNQELDTRIQQLGRLIMQLQVADKPAPILAPTQPARAIASEQIPTARAPVLRTVKAATPSFRRLRQAERWGVVVLVAAGLGVGAWGAARLARQAKPSPAATAAPRSSPAFQVEEGVAPPPVYVVDSSLAAPALRVDTAGASLSATAVSPDGEPAATPISHAPSKPLTDSTTAPATTAPTPLIIPDSAAVPSPTP